MDTGRISGEARESRFGPIGPPLRLTTRRTYSHLRRPQPSRTSAFLPSCSVTARAYWGLSAFVNQLETLPVSMKIFDPPPEVPSFPSLSRTIVVQSDERSPTLLGLFWFLFLFYSSHTQILTLLHFPGCLVCSDDLHRPDSAAAQARQ